MTEQPKIAVVTGSNRGLGYAIARKLGQKPDIKVIITSRRKTEGLAAKDQLVAEGIQAALALEYARRISRVRF
ncbi:SDR family NAD(P)-dependent oxidoreductase [Oculatella sp. FACHB-28]|uniref:SDR family NAD(P)-dependent oxidoreductase n=1 Tax=Oculatella sp. FACHB-28 TaxID=2692845 RepID=UPI001688552B|nr:SDR family NAD(P)-dependent oxidoreductase [Oculatella sp. FACHB-28]MBD2060651.1 SDR family NAD(P)-dependent oxidoreductase [Oculatella sp. FACHB-28]